MTKSRRQAENGPLFRAAWEDRVSDPESRAAIQRGVAAMRAALAGGNQDIQPEAKEETIEELAEHVAAQRRAALAAKAVVETVGPDMLDFVIPGEQATSPPRTWENLQGGAFGGALKRRIETLDLSEEDKYQIQQADFDAVSHQTVRHKLLTANGDQAYEGILFTGREFGSLTFSPKMLVSRVGGQVIAGTEGRNQDSRVARTKEVVSGTLQDRLAKLEDLIASLDSDRAAFRRLEDEMKTPGYAHMKIGDMSALMSRTEGTIRSMIDAIASDVAVDADRLKGIQAALDYQLGNPDYRAAFSYWKDMTNLSGHWTRRKLAIAQKMKSKLVAEIENRP